MRLRRFDRFELIIPDSARKDDGGIRLERDSRGFARVGLKPARVGPLRYMDEDGNEWTEYRSPEETFAKDSLETYRNAPITDGHPLDDVTLANVHELSIGTTDSKVSHDDQFVQQTGVLFNKDAIDRIERGDALELSIGYYADVVRQDGVLSDGTAFQAVQRNVKVNHIALVERGRAGSECAVYPPGEIQHKDSTQMANKKKDNEAPEVEEQKTAPVEAQSSEAEGEINEPSDALAELKAVRDELKALREQVSKADAERIANEAISQQKADGLNIDQIVRERGEVIDLAKVAFPHRDDLHELSTQDLKVEICKEAFKSQESQVEAKRGDSVGINHLFGLAKGVIAERRRNNDALSDLSLSLGRSSRSDSTDPHGYSQAFGNLHSFVSKGGAGDVN